MATDHNFRTSISLVIILALYCLFNNPFNNAGQLKLEFVHPTAAAQDQATAAGGQRSLGLLHAKGVDAVIRMAAEEIAGLVEAAYEGDERAQTVLYELAVQFCAMLTIDLACAAMVPRSF